MKLKHLFIALLGFTIFGANAQETEVQYLSGTDKDNTRKWEFFCSEGRNSGYWTTIEVPGHWDTQGFGGYNYGHDANPHREKGFYRHEFAVSPEWKDKEIYIVFEGSMTDTEVRVNGELAGPIHQGGFYRFKYDITPLIRFDADNLLEVAVSKESSNESINRAERRADYWIFGGIYRPVYLEAQPKSFIERVAIDARHDGGFWMQTFVNSAEPKNLSVEATIKTLDGKVVGTPFAATLSTDGTAVLRGSVANPAVWTSESPNMHKVEVALKDGERIIHIYEQKFGFRTIEFRPSDGFYVNGVKVKFKGVCRHTFWPESGRAISKELAIEDVNLIKDMNMNAVRMSHYPPDSYFLDVCDSLGLYVIDELAGWQKFYDGDTAKRLAKSMVARDVNHPSVVIWSNGNEGGFPKEARGEYAIHDPQHRQVIEPWSLYDGVDTRHYPKYAYTKKALTEQTNVYMPTEFLHGLHDGGHGAGLEDYWELMLKSPYSAGGFLWSLIDEGLVRQDQNNSIDVQGNLAPDGILGPHREKEGSFYAIKEIWTPVYVAPPVLEADFDGVLAVENRYHFTNLNQCKYSYSLERFKDGLTPHTATIKKAPIIAPNVQPGHSGKLALKLPANWASYDVLRLNITDHTGRDIYSKTWNITSAKQMAGRLIEGQKSAISVKETDELLRVSVGETEITFNKTNGQIENVCHKLKLLSFGGGPRFAGLETQFVACKHYRADNGYVVENKYANGEVMRWIINDNGWLELDYNYTLNGEYHYAGITFSYPEHKVKKAVLMANGPYHVWQNRLKGVHFGIHEKTYNNTITGYTWVYPEFNGYYSNFYGVKIETDELPFTIVTENEGIYLHMFTPKKAPSYVENVGYRFPDGDISLLNAISAVGTKFSRAEQEGPQGAKAKFDNAKFVGKLYFKFGE